MSATDIIATIAAELDLAPGPVTATVALFDEGNTIPFVARYRKEVTGMRGLLFGIKEEYRQLGLPFVGLDYLFGVAKRTTKYHYLELGWNLEDNDAINQLEREGRARPFKKYRIFRKSFSDRW